MSDFLDEQIEQNVIRVSYSKQKTIAACGKKYVLNYHEKIRPIHKKSFFVTGDISHQCTELFWKDRGIPFDKAEEEGKKLIDAYIEEHRKQEESEIKKRKLQNNQAYMEWFESYMEESYQSAMMGLIYALNYKKNFIDKNPHLIIAVVNDKTLNENRIQTEIELDGIRYIDTNICDRILYDTITGEYIMEELKNYAAGNWVKDSEKDDELTLKQKTINREFFLRNNTQTQKYILQFERHYGIKISRTIYNVVIKTTKNPLSALYEEYDLSVTKPSSLMGKMAVSYTVPPKTQRATKPISKKKPLLEKFGAESEVKIDSNVMEYLVDEKALSVKTKRAETFGQFWERMKSELLDDEYNFTSTNISVEYLDRRSIETDILLPMLRMIKRGEEGDLIMMPIDVKECKNCDYYDLCRVESDKDEYNRVLNTKYKCRR